MNVAFIPASHHCAILGCALPAAEVAGHTLLNLQMHRLDRAGLSLCTDLGLAQVLIMENAWLSDADLLQLAAGHSIVVDGMPLAGGNSGGILELTRCVESKESFAIVHPWDLLRLNELLLAELAADELHGQIHPAAHIEGHIRLGKGSRILPGVFIEGHVSIGENCKIGPNCYIRGATHIGDKCHVGNAVEIKNSILMSGTNVGHLSYVGDSILAHKVNFGAGTLTSNLRHDGANHRSLVQGTLVDTGRRKFGTVVGAGVHTGINTSIYPGRKLWPHTSTLPGEIVSKDVGPR